MTTARRSFRSFSLLALLSLSACDSKPEDTDPPPSNGPAATLRGQLTMEPDTELNGPVRLALAWYPTLLAGDTGTLMQPTGIVTEDLAFSGGFPASYTFDVRTPPPADALVELGEGMKGKGAAGILLAYNDGNGNGTLDTIPADGAPVDHVLGASLAWTRPPAFMVIYLDSAQAPATGLKQGFNLMRINSNLSSELVPLDTSIPLSLHDDPMLDAFVCEAAWDGNTEQVPCGLPGHEAPDEDTLELFADAVFKGNAADFSLAVSQDGASVKDAQVTVGDLVAAYDAERGRYILHLDEASTVVESGLVTLVARRGDAAVGRTVVVPSDFQVTWPTVPMSYSPGAPMQVAWTKSQGATRYSVRVIAGEGYALASTGTQKTSLSVTPEAYEGTATLRIEAINVNDRLMMRRVREVPLSFTACDTVTPGSGLTVEGYFMQLAPDFLGGEESSEVHADVKDDGVSVTDAKVLLSGWDVPYVREVGAFHNGFYTLGGGTGLGDTVELRVMRQGEVLCRTLTLPGDFALHLDAPVRRPTGSSWSMDWTRAQGAVQYELWLGKSFNEPVYSASTNELEYTFENIDFVGELDLRFSAVAHPAHNDTLGWMDVKRTRIGSATFTQ
ncbi:hypothetical protein JY651_18465 [Pyxidicoccus parkwayensis]|uniref:Lipoprotein n=1 Tax=Pyxidicoccus parkwayensis TaxID=2813578 RepID=A0ABX7P8M9_9BACT|nr:hypothetical protein [Pyxidicoccus parkwaysis]QSQ26781.1 hypothetical protein JY651_18465 [Pyxidicoccus parkwaysis]